MEAFWVLTWTKMFNVQWDWSWSYFEYIVPRQGPVREKPMFMCCSQTFDSVVGRKQANYVIWELIYEFCICYELCKWNIKFCELISIYWVQWLMLSVKMALLGSIMKCGKWGVYWIKNSENWSTQVQVTSHWTLICLPWPLTLLSISKYIKCVY